MPFFITQIDSIASVYEKLIQKDKDGKVTKGNSENPWTMEDLSGVSLESHIFLETPGKNWIKCSKIG